MFCLMLLLFGAVVFISGTDPKKLKDFINKNDQSHYEKDRPDGG